MLEEIIAVLDGGPGYEGYRLIRQDGRPQIADIRREALYEAERLRQLQHLLTNTEKLVQQYREAVARDLHLIRSIYGRIGALTRAMGARRRWADLLHSAILSGATLPYRQRRAIYRLTGVPPDQLLTIRGMSLALQRLQASIEAYRDTVTRLYTQASAIVERYRAEREELARLQEAARRYRHEIQSLLPRVEASKRVIVDYVDHIMLEVTYATETCEGHEPFVAEIHAYTTVTGMENITKKKLAEIESEMDACLNKQLPAILGEFFGAAATSLAAKLVKIGYRYLYYDEIEEPLWPTIAIEIEYGWPDTPQTCYDYARSAETGSPMRIEDISRRTPGRIPRIEVVCV